MEKTSLNGNRWIMQSADDRAAQALALQMDLPLILAQILSARGVDVASAPNFLNPKLSNLMPDPYSLKDMKKAAERLADAVMNNEKIGIIGDYDTDGATSTAVLKMFLETLGVQVATHIPEREEGYGPSEGAFAEFKAFGANLIVTVDCGTTAFDVLNQASADGFDVIVLDHHEAEALLPNVLAVVNPKRLDEENDYPYLKFMAAVGVVFMSVAAVNRVLREKGYYQTHQEPDLKQYLDLVALGTVCDVVPLLGLNRAYVKQGLKVMATRQNIGLKALSDVAHLEQAPTAYHLGYVLGPRLNAGGRVGKASTGSALLCANDNVVAQKLAEELNTYNTERKDIESFVLLEAIEMLEGTPQEYPMAFVAGSNWHQGVIGIVAGKLKERYNLPSFVMSIEDDEVKGSARSIAGLDLGALIMAAKEKGLLTKGGGHTMAAGFSLNENQIEPFKVFAGEYIKNRLGSEKLVPEINIDASVALSGANLSLAETLATLEPFGAGNQEPTLLISGVQILRPMLVGVGHVRCLLSKEGAPRLKAVAFRSADTAVGKAMLAAKGERYDIVGKLRTDSWQGQTMVQFIIEDMRSVDNA